MSRTVLFIALCCVVLGVAGGVARGEAAPSGEPRIVAGEVVAPVLLTRVEPEYPEVARRAMQFGKVILQAVVATDGRVASLKVLRGHPLFDDAALAAARQWTYKPATLKGEPVSVYFTIIVTFQLGNVGTLVGVTDGLLVADFGTQDLGQLPRPAILRRRDPARTTELPAAVGHVEVRAVHTENDRPRYDVALVDGGPAQTGDLVELAGKTALPAPRP